MQVEVRDICADKARRGDPNLSVHVRAIEVNLAAKLVYNVAHFTDRFFIHAVSRRIGHHDAGEIRSMLFCFCSQIVQVDVAVLITSDNHNLHPRHLCGCRVSAVGRSRDQTDIAVAFVTAFVIVTNRQQTRIFALRAGVRLHADGVITGQFCQPLGKLADHLVITFCLLWRAVRVKFSEFRPGDRDHLGGSVQLHGARTQRDHCLVQRQIFALQRVHVAHHLGFTVIAIEYRVAQDGVIAQHTFLNRTAVVRHFFVQGVDIQTVAVAQQNRKQLQDIFTGGGFVERNAYCVMDVTAQVDFCRLRTRQHCGFVRHFHAQRVKIVGMAQF